MRLPSGGERWGILGGNFDPVHLGHLNLVKEIDKIKRFNGVLFILSASHPFKKNQSIAPFEDRYRMLDLALASENSYLPSSIEKDMSLSGYTLDTIKALKQKYPSVEFYFIIGSDNLMHLRNWHSPDEIVKEVKLISGNRPDYLNDPSSVRFLKNIEFVNINEVDISSSRIRTIFKSDRDSVELNHYLNPEVLEYIRDKKLYL